MYWVVVEGTPTAYDVVAGPVTYEVVAGPVTYEVDVNGAPPTAYPVVYWGDDEPYPNDARFGDTPDDDPYPSDPRLDDVYWGADVFP